MFNTLDVYILALLHPLYVYILALLHPLYACCANNASRTPDSYKSISKYIYLYMSKICPQCGFDNDLVSPIGSPRRRRSRGDDRFSINPKLSHQTSTFVCSVCTTSFKVKNVGKHERASNASRRTYLLTFLDGVSHICEFKMTWAVGAILIRYLGYMYRKRRKEAYILKRAPRISPSDLIKLHREGKGLPSIVVVTANVEPSALGAECSKCQPVSQGVIHQVATTEVG